jgi:zona occludens toxin (predicted ATPase)
MIQMLEGVPGSGKSYYAVTEYLLKWVRAGRRIYCFIDGFYLDRLALFEGIAVEVLMKQITLWKSPDEVRAGLLTVQPGSAVCIDEVQTVFRSKEKQDPEVLRWLETHRHYGVDLVLMCQQYGQVTLGVNRLIEGTIKFRRLDRFGLRNRFQAHVRGNPDEVEVIRTFSGKFSPKLYQYYSSYSAAAIKETKRGNTILKSPTIIIGIIGILGAAAWFSQGHWLTPAADVQQRDARKPLTRADLPLPPPLPEAKAELPVEAPQSVPIIHPVRVQGGLYDDRQERWVYITQSGQVVTDDEIAVLSGGIVNARMERGVRKLSGSGVIWGGEHEPSTLVVGYRPSASPADTAARQDPTDVEPIPSSNAGPLATPLDSMLRTPPGLP